jgi:hypothetical protein
MCRRDTAFVSVAIWFPNSTAAERPVGGLLETFGSADKVVWLTGNISFGNLTLFDVREPLG